MIEQQQAYEDKIREAELITGIRKQKIDAYNAYISNADEILADDLLGPKDPHRLEITIKRLEYLENLMTEETALKIQELYLEEDRKMYNNIIKRRAQYTADIENGEFEKHLEKLKEKVQEIKRKTGGKGDTTAMTNLLIEAVGVTTLESQIDIYEQLKIYTSK